MSEVMSISEVSRRVGEPIHIVDHAVRRHGPEPCGRVGITRMWHVGQRPAIKAALVRNEALRRAPKRMPPRREVATV